MKNVSTGNWITIFVVIANMVFFGGIMFKDVLNAQDTANTALDMAYNNDKQIAVIVTTIEQGFKNQKYLIENLEHLIRNGE